MDVNDFLEATEGARADAGGCTWKLEEERRSLNVETVVCQHANHGDEWVGSLRGSAVWGGGLDMGTSGSSVGMAEPLASRSKRF